MQKGLLLPSKTCFHTSPARLTLKGNVSTQTQQLVKIPFRARSHWLELGLLSFLFLCLYLATSAINTSK